MKKAINLIKKHDIDVIILVIAIMVFPIFFTFLNCYDELWNFANSYKIFKGYKIYQDINIIVTPLFFYIAQVFFKIFGATMLSYRIYNVVISTTLIILIYKIFKALKITRRRAVFYTIIIEFILLSIILGGANYNILAIIPILTNIFLILKNKDNNIITGIILLITFMIKQNIGVYFAIGIFAYKMVIRKITKETIISLLKIYSIAFIGIIAFLLQLYFNGNLYYFISYCFLGISEFGEKNLVVSFYNITILIIAIISAIFTLILINNKKTKSRVEKEVIQNSKILLCFGIPVLFISYPIFNYCHMALGSLILIICFIYTLENIILKEILNNRKKEIILFSAVILIYLANFGIRICIGIYKSPFCFEKQGPYYGSFIKQEDIEDINIICNYIEEKEKEGIEVKILSYKANLYMVSLGKTNEKYDLAFYGNLGKAGEEGLINEVSKLKSTLLLIPTNEEDVFEQESKKVRDYIINTYKKVGEIQKYSIYMPY